MTKEIEKLPPSSSEENVEKRPTIKDLQKELKGRGETGVSKLRKAELKQRLKKVKESEFEQARERLTRAEANMEKITGVRGFLGFEKEAKTEESREAVKEEYETALRDYEAKKEELLKDVDKEKESFDKEGTLTPEQEQEAVPKEKEKLADINKEAEDTTQKAKELLAGELKYLDIEPKEIFEKLSDKEIKTLHKLMEEKDDEKIVAFYKEKIQEVAVSQGKEDLLIKGKAEEIAQNIHQIIQQTIEAEAQAAVSKFGWGKAGKMVGGILKNFALIGGAAKLIAAAGIATGGTGVVVMAGGLALTRLITKKIERKAKQKKATKTEEKFQKQLEQARNKAQEDLFEDVEKLKRELSGLMSNEMRRQTSKEAITTLKEYEKAKVEGKDKVLESKLQDLEKEFYLNALTKVRAEYPDVDEWQQKDMAVQMAMTLAQHERGEHEARKRLEALKNEKPKVYELVQKFNLLRSGTPDKKPEGMTEEEQGIWEKYKYDIISLATGTAIGVAIRSSSLGRVVAGAIGGVGIGYVLGEAGGKKTEIKGIKEIELMIDEAEKVIKDIEFPAEELPQLRENVVLVQSRIELGLLDSNPLLKSRAENFIHNVRQVEFANQRVLSELLWHQQINTQKLEEKIEQDVSRIEKKTKRRKLISMVGGGLGGALTAGYFTKEGKEILGLGEEAAPEALAEIEAEVAEVTPEVVPEALAEEAAEAGEAQAEAPEAPVEIATEPVPEHLDYQDGDSIWQEVENQMDDRSAFKEWYESADTHDAERTYAIDYIKDKVVESPQEYFSEEYLPADVDNVTSEQLENLDWDKLFCEASSAEELEKVMTDLSDVAKQSIIENNELLAEYVSKTSEAIDSSTVDQLLTDIKDAGDVDQYLQSLEAAEAVEPVLAEVGEEYWEDLTDKMNEALAAGDEDQIKALVLEAVQNEPDWALDQSQTQFFLRVLEGNDGVIGKDFGGLVAEGNDFNKDTLDLAIEHFKEKAMSGKLPDSDMWTPRYVYDDTGQQQMVNMKNTGSRLFPKYEIDYNGDGAVEKGDIVKGFGAKKELLHMMESPLDTVSIATEEVEEVVAPVETMPEPEQAEVLETKEATPEQVFEKAAAESTERVTEIPEEVPTFETVQAEPDTLLTSEDSDKFVQTINKFKNIPEATKQELPGIIDTIKQEYPSADKYILKETPDGSAQIDFYDEQGNMLASSYTKGDLRAPLEVTESIPEKTPEAVVGEEVPGPKTPAEEVADQPPGQTAEQAELTPETEVPEKLTSFRERLLEYHEDFAKTEQGVDRFILNDQGEVVIEGGKEGTTFGLDDEGNLISYKGDHAHNILEPGQSWRHITHAEVAKMEMPGVEVVSEPETPVPLEESAPAEKSIAEEKVIEEPTEVTAVGETAKTASIEEVADAEKVIIDLGGLEEVGKDPEKFQDFISTTLEGNEKGQKIARSYFEKYHNYREVTGHAAEEAIRLANGPIPKDLNDLIFARQDELSGKIEKLIQNVKESGPDWGKGGTYYRSGNMSPEEFREVYKNTEMSEWVEKLGLDRKTFSTNRARQLFKSL
ncbi:hypothetical protein MYX06_02815 [Patescibacteria group bacterium AH-259-L05]|nr:hypothetical protein [Patescibacteria group bacterium AH-259-L05]